MRCLFCKLPSDAATSVEHVIPQSLGNSQVILPRGMICDPCNNYIARKIEQPLLAHESFRNLRAWYRIPNKRGRHPSLYGVIPGIEPPRDCRRPFGLNYAAIGVSSSMA